MQKKISETTVNVQMAKQHFAYDEPIYRILTNIRPDQAERIMRILREEYPDTSSCINYISACYTDEIACSFHNHFAIPVPHRGNRQLRITDIKYRKPTCYKRFAGNAVSYPHRCMQNMADGKCTDEFMRKIAEILYPAKYGYTK